MFSYKLQKNFGAVYDRANLLFSPDGTRLYSPCGNKVMAFNIQNSDSQALPLQILYNIDRMDLNPLGNLMIVVNEKAQLLIISMVSNTVLHRKDFQEMGKIYDLKFSPDGKFYAVCGSKQINVYYTPGFAVKGGGRLFTPFKLKQIIKASNEEMTSIAWNGTSQLLLVTSKDFTMRVYPIDEKLADRCKPLSLTAHNDLIVGAFFSSCASDPLNIYSISRNGQLFLWKATHKTLEELFAEEGNALLNYKIIKKKFLFEDIKEVHSNTKVTSFAYRESTKLLIVGFSNGQFLLYEVPQVVLIHAREIATKGPISSVVFNKKGSLVALGSGVGLGTKYDVEVGVTNSTHLIVWDWQSESYLLKQSGYSNNVSNSYECFAFSNTGDTIVTGSTDGRIKVWNRQSGFSSHTFNEHKGPVTALEFVPNKNSKVFVSASLDGTVKVHDLNRYRTFRTLAAPNEEKPAQFICLAVDKISGDFIAAGSHNMFEIHLWSLKTGRLLDVLTGHQGPVSALKFSTFSNTLYSSSWDSTARIWNVFEGSNCTKEIIKLGSDAMDLDFRPDGSEFAVCTLNGVISFFNAHTGDQTGIGIEGKDDLGVTRYSGEVVNDKYKYFRTVAYSVDGEYVIAGGNAKFICLYNVKTKLLVKKFEIVNNLSLDGYEEFVSKRKIQEFGFNLSLIRHRENNDGNAPINLPGVKKSDFADRSMAPIVAVHQIQFSSTMRSFVFVSTEGVSLYSIDSENIFDPFELDTDITPLAVRKALSDANYQTSLLKSIKLQDENLIKQVIESVPVNEIRLLVDGLANQYIHKLIEFFTTNLPKSKHIEFYMKWIAAVLTQKGLALKEFLPGEVFTSLMSNLHGALVQNSSHLNVLCRNVRFATQFMNSIGQSSDSPMEIECE